MGARASADTSGGDRRVLTIGVVTMVLFLLVGVGSAVVFARPDCRLLAPTADAAPQVYDGADVAEVFDEPSLIRFVDALDTSGTVTVMDAAGTNQVVRFGDGIVAQGERLIALDPTLTPISTIRFRDAMVVGSGETVYAFVPVNATTGQIDALQPIRADLTTGTCVELALVSTPLAFFKDAADGEALLLRADEDGGDPFLEVRDTATGRRYSTPVSLTVGSAGQHGARTSGALHDDLVVFTQDVTDGTDNEIVVWGLNRTDGSVRFTVTADVLKSAVGVPIEGDLELVRTETELMLLVDGRDMFTIGSATGELTRRDTYIDGMAPIWNYPEPVLAAAEDVLFYGVVAHTTGDVFLVHAPPHTVLVTVTAP